MYFWLRLCAGYTYRHLRRHVFAFLLSDKKKATHDSISRLCILSGSWVVQVLDTNGLICLSSTSGRSYHNSGLRNRQRHVSDHIGVKFSLPCRSRSSCINYMFWQWVARGGPRGHAPPPQRLLNVCFSHY